MSDSDELIAAAAEAEERGAIREAIALLRQATLNGSQSASVWAWLGQLHARDEQYAAAEEAYRHALIIEPQLAASHSGLAGVLEDTNRLEDAEAEYRKSIALQPTSSRYVLLGVLQASRGRDADAVASLRHALRLEADNEEAMVNLAMLIREHAPDEAERLLRTAIEIDPLYAAAYRELGFLAAGTDRHAEAEDLLRTALSLDHGDRWVPLYLGNVLWSQGRVREAEEVLGKTCVDAPLWGLPHRLLANVYEADGRTQDALDHYRIAASLAPEDADGAFRLAQLLAAMGNAREARHWVERTLQLDNTHSGARGLQERLRSTEQGGC